MGIFLLSWTFSKSLKAVKGNKDKKIFQHTKEKS